MPGEIHSSIDGVLDVPELAEGTLEHAQPEGGMTIEEAQEFWSNLFASEQSVRDFKPAEVQTPEKAENLPGKRETEMTVDEAKSFWERLFSKEIDPENISGADAGTAPEQNIERPMQEMFTPEKRAELLDEKALLHEYYNPYEVRSSNIPVDGVRGKWEGERGKSKYIPSNETDEGKVVQDRLSEKGLDGIEYRYAEPDFSECAEATVEIEDMTENRLDYIDADGNERQGNFAQADEECAEQWNTIEKDGRSNWTAADIRDWRRENGFSWHERCDTKTMDLVSRDIHGYFRHYGGCSECKARDALKATGGRFDE